jgi:hypothetical protein
MSRFTFSDAIKHYFEIFDVQKIFDVNIKIQAKPISGVKTSMQLIFNNVETGENYALRLSKSVFSDLEIISPRGTDGYYVLLDDDPKIFIDYITDDTNMPIKLFEFLGSPETGKKKERLGSSKLKEKEPADEGTSKQVDKVDDAYIAPDKNKKFSSFEDIEKYLAEDKDNRVAHYKKLDETINNPINFELEILRATEGGDIKADQKLQIVKSLEQVKKDGFKAEDMAKLARELMTQRITAIKEKTKPLLGKFATRQSELEKIRAIKI